MTLKTILFLLITASVAFTPFAAQTAHQTAEPVVYAILFWEESCPNCEKVLNEFLPGFQARLGNQFSLEMIEVVSLEDINRLFQVGEAYGLSKDEIGVPLLVIGDHALAGSVDIPEKLPGLVESYLAAGGVETVLRETPLQVAPAVDEVQDDGMWLAWITMAVMALGLLVTAWQVWRAFDGDMGFSWPGWVTWLTPLLSVIGIFVAVYLTFIEATQAQAICGPLGDCNAVQNSKYAMLFGFIPVGLLGLVGYLAILAAWVAQRSRLGLLTEYAPVAILGMGVFGTIFSVYLTYLEIFVIHAVCIWCISSAWIMTLLMVLSLPAAARWLAAAEEEEA